MVDFTHFRDVGKIFDRFFALLANYCIILQLGKCPKNGCFY